MTGITGGSCASSAVSAMVEGLFKSSFGSGADSAFSGASAASEVAAVSGFVATVAGFVAVVLGSVAASAELAAVAGSVVSAVVPSVSSAEFVSSSDWIVSFSLVLEEEFFFGYSEAVFSEALGAFESIDTASFTVAPSFWTESERSAV